MCTCENGIPPFQLHLYTRKVMPDGAFDLEVQEQFLRRSGPQRMPMLSALDAAERVWPAEPVLEGIEKKCTVDGDAPFAA